MQITQTPQTTKNMLPSFGDKATVGKKKFESIMRLAQEEARLEAEVALPELDFSGFTQAELHEAASNQMRQFPSRYDKVGIANESIVKELIRTVPDVRKGLNWIDDLPDEYGMTGIDLYMAAKKGTTFDVVYPPRYRTILHIDEMTVRGIRLEDDFYPILNPHLVAYLMQTYPEEGHDL